MKALGRYGSHLLESTGAGPVALLKNSDDGGRRREGAELLDRGGRAVHRRGTADTRCRPERQGCPPLPAHRAI